MSKPTQLLWLSDRHGIYIPRDFANSFEDRARHVSGIDDETWAILENGPDNEAYWDAWARVEQDATVTDTKGFKYRIHLDGDCWLVPVDMEWNEETDSFEYADE